MPTIVLSVDMRQCSPPPAYQHGPPSFNEHSTIAVVAFPASCVLLLCCAFVCLRLNIKSKSNRVHSLPQPSGPKVPQVDVIEWVNKTLAEEWAGSPAGDLGSGEADQAFVRQVLRVRCLDIYRCCLSLSLVLSLVLSCLLILLGP